ncbi:MAG: F0F1 ATP synthase subunit epsilon [Rhodomicrobium sp.]
MAETFHFELVSPERQLMAADIVEAVIPGQEGDLAALANHALLISQIRPGILTTRAGTGEEKQFFLRGGFADVGPSETVVIAEYAVPLQNFTSAMLTDEIAQAQQAFDDARDDASRFSAQDRLERLQSLQPRIDK